MTPFPFIQLIWIEALGVVFWEIFVTLSPTAPIIPPPYSDLGDGPMLDTLLLDRLESGERLKLSPNTPSALIPLLHNIHQLDPNNRPTANNLIQRLNLIIASL